MWNHKQFPSNMKKQQSLLCQTLDIAMTHIGCLILFFLIGPLKQNEHKDPVSKKLWKYHSLARRAVKPYENHLHFRWREVTYRQARLGNEVGYLCTVCFALRRLTYIYGYPERARQCNGRKKSRNNIIIGNIKARVLNCRLNIIPIKRHMVELLGRSEKQSRKL